MRHAAPFVVLLLLLPLAPAVPAADAPGEALTVRAPREGDLARVTLTHNDSVYGPGSSFARTVAWTGPARDFADAFGAARRAYTVDVRTQGCICEGDGRLDVEMTSRLVVGRSSEHAREPYTMRPERGHEIDVHVDEMRVQSYYGRLEPMWLVQGRTLHAGDAYQVQVPTSPWSGTRWMTAEVRAIGWEDGLFRVDVHDLRGLWDWRAYYDGQTPFPVYLNWTQHNHEREIWRETRLVSWTDGAGAPLDEPAYVPPAWTTGPADTARSAYTADGPSEAMLPGLPLADAARAARQHPDVQAWLARYPDGFVVGGEGESGVDGADPRWLVKFGIPWDERQSQARVFVHVARGADGVPRVTSVEERTDWPGIGRLASLTDTDLACGEAGFAAALARLAHGDAPRAGRRVEFQVYGGEIVCSATLIAPLEGHEGDEERTFSATAKLQGRPGWAGEWRTHRYEATHTYEELEDVPPPLVLPLPPLPPLPSLPPTP